MYNVVQSVFEVARGRQSPDVNGAHSGSLRPTYGVPSI